MSNVTKTFGAFIRLRRLELGYTQEQMAKLLGISQVAYGRYELGIREPEFEMLIQIAKILGFRLGEFFDRYVEDKTWQSN